MYRVKQQIVQEIVDLELVLNFRHFLEDSNYFQVRCVNANFILVWLRLFLVMETEHLSKISKLFYSIDGEYLSDTKNMYHYKITPCSSLKLISNQAAQLARVW